MPGALLGLEEGCRRVGSGGVVVYPTETLWGIGGSALEEAVAQRVRDVKQILSLRSVPILAHEPGEVLSRVRGRVSGLRELMEAFWPGGLTLVVPVSDEALVRRVGDDGRVGFRISAHPVATALARAAGGLLVSTSANVTGCAAPRSLSDLDEVVVRRVDGVVSGAEPNLRVPSTVLVYEPSGVWRVARDGAISRQALSRWVVLEEVPA